MKLFIVMSLTLLISSSSFFLSEFLNDKLKKDDFNEKQFTFAFQNDYQQALKINQIKADIHSEDWLVITQKLAKVEGLYAYQLAKYHQEDQREEKAILWYQQAIRLSYPPATLALAQLYFAQNNLILTKKIIEQSSDESTGLLPLRMKVAIVEGNNEFIAKNSDRLKKSVAGEHLFAEMIRYKVIDMQKPLINVEVINVEVNNDIEEGSPAKCVATVQLFATRINHLKQTEKLITQFKTHPLNDYLCFSQVRYVPITQLACTHENNEAINCDELHWQKLAKSIHARYIGVMLPHGGAKVHLGIMYLDKNDTVQVFAHELSHLLGFIDEYPLPAKHMKCDDIQSEAFSHNVVVLKSNYQGNKEKIRQYLLAQLPWAHLIKNETPILSKHQKGWRLGTPASHNKEVGVFIAKTCDFSKNNAFKPTSFRTQLMYFEKAFPHEYTEIFTNKPEQYLMPSFHYNIGRALLNKGQLEKANFWLLQAAAFEKDNNRRLSILKGHY